MAAGAVFKLIANDGKADRMIMATELLNNRIKDITCMRARHRRDMDPTPTLVDIEKTHILFVNAHFKPFAAIAYEYQKVRSGSGTTNFGGSVQFSIPQFGDFIFDMVANVQLAEVAATGAAAGDVPAFPPVIGTLDPSSTALKQVSTVDNGGGANVLAVHTYEYVRSDGTVIDRATEVVNNFVRYVEFPGQRLFKKVKFDVNGNPLDEYTGEVMNFHQKFRVAPGKLTGWKRLVGQEVAVDAISDYCTIDGKSAFAAAATGLLDTNGAAAAVAPQLALQTSRRMTKILTGPQTPKALQPALNMWIPLLFWFNTDARLAIPSVAIPYGQRYITIDLEDQSKIVQVAPGDLSLRLTTEFFTNATGTAAGTGITDYKSVVTQEPVIVPTSIVDSTQQIKLVELYINNIFMNPEIHDIYIKRIGFSLIRVYRQQSNSQNQDTNEILLSQLKWPIETMYAGLRPKFNARAAVYSGLGLQSGNKNEWRDWHRYTRLVDRVCHTTSTSSGALGNFLAGDAYGALNKQSVQSVSERLTYAESKKTFTTLSLNAHGIDIYQDIDTAFFSDYMPYQYGGYNIVTPEDEGAVMINFCLYPGTYQPSGHVNLSRAREFRLKFTSKFVGAADLDDPAKPAAAEAELIVVAIAINFLLISDGSAVLRYST